MLQEDGTEEDFCSACLTSVYTIDLYSPRTYTFEDLCNDYHVPEQYSE